VHAGLGHGKVAAIGISIAKGGRFEALPHFKGGTEIDAFRVTIAARLLVEKRFAGFSGCLGLRIGRAEARRFLTPFRPFFDFSSATSSGWSGV
jgi:hypothetical protein